MKGLQILDADLSTSLLPRNVGSFFPNLIAYYVRESKVTHVTRDDFADLPNLIQINLLNNNIQVIAGDFLQGHPNLKSFDLDDNPLRHIGYNVFDNLHYLEDLHLFATTCFNDHAHDLPSVDILIFQASVRCPPTFEMTETKILDGEGFKRRVDDKVADEVVQVVGRLEVLEANVTEIEVQVASKLEKAVDDANNLLNEKILDLEKTLQESSARTSQQIAVLNNTISATELNVTHHEARIQKLRRDLDRELMTIPPSI